MDLPVAAYPFSRGFHTFHARIDRELFSALHPDGIEVQSERRGLAPDAEPHPPDHCYRASEFGSCRQDRAVLAQYGREEHGDDRIADVREPRPDSPLLADG